MSALAFTLPESTDDYIFTFSDVTVNLDRAMVYRDGRRVPLSRCEFELLTCFLHNPERTLTRDWILESVWTDLPDPNTRTVDAHVMRLRRKLENDPANPQYFLTMHKSGYRFSPSGLHGRSCFVSR
jgi:DNA-binding response OmpR family regulator